jgi:hypothetical protein
MQVRCVENDRSKLPTRFLVSRLGYGADRVEPVTVGRVYTVVALLFDLGFVWYFIHDDHDHPYPMAYQSILFEIVDPRVSRYWEATVRPSASSDLEEAMALEPSEWARDKLFFDRLTNFDDATIHVYAEVRKRIEDEFA